MSSRRSHGGIRESSASRTRSGSGPPSTSIRAPVRVSSRIASPCPTSRTVSRVVPVDRVAERQRPRWRRPAPPRRARCAGFVRGAAAFVVRAAGRAGSLDRRARAGRRRRSPRTAAGPPRIATPAAAAAASAPPGGRVTAANGTAAANRTIATMTWSTIQPGRPAIVATTGGAPSRLARPRASIATTPPSMAAGTSGHDREVDDRRDERQPAERREHVRERRRLRGQRDPEALREPSRHPPAGDAAQVPRQRVRPRQEAGRRHDGEAEPGVGDHARGRSAGAAPRQFRGPQARARRGRSRARGGRRRPSRRPGRPTTRRRRRRRRRPPSPGSRGRATVAIGRGGRPRRGRRRSRCSSPRSRRRGSRPRSRSPRRASRSTRSRRPTRIPAASPASGSGSARCRASPLASRSVWRPIGDARTSVRALCVERARRARSPQVRAIRIVVRRRAEPALDLDDVPRGDGRERRQGRRDRHLAAVRVQAQPRDLVAVPRRSDGLDDGGPRPRVLGQRRSRRAGGACENPQR